MKLRTPFIKMNIDQRRANNEGKNFDSLMISLIGVISSFFYLFWFA